jgi:hypothetical protein
VTYFNDMEAIYEPPGAPPMIVNGGVGVIGFNFRLCKLCGAVVHPDRGMVHYDWHIDLRPWKGQE